MNRKRSRILSILLLDDSAALGGLYKRHLEATGRFTVTAETDGRRARRQADLQLFDLVVIDAKVAYRGVEFGGLRLADDIRPRYGARSIIVMSRYITADLIRERELDYEFIEKTDDANGRRFVGSLADRLLEMRQSQYAFVAMPFDNKHDRIYHEAIAPAVKKERFACVRADDVHHNQGIQATLFELIKESKFVILLADDANPNAYYEAGIADALGKEVMIIASSLSELRVDVSHRYTIVHRGEYQQLRAAIGTKVSAMRMKRRPGAP